MNIYGAAPEGNDLSKREHACYFNLAIEQIQEAETQLRAAPETARPLLLHLEVFLILGRRYPEMASWQVSRLNIGQIKGTFDAWYERSSPDISAQHWKYFKEAVDNLFAELEKIGAVG